MDKKDPWTMCNTTLLWEYEDLIAEDIKTGLDDDGRSRKSDIKQVIEHRMREGIDDL